MASRMRLLGITVVFGLLTCLQGADAKEWKTIRIATEGAFPPFNDTNAAGELVGFDIDIAKALCEKMQVTCQFRAEDWDNLMPALNAGKFDAVVSSMPMNDERRKWVAFSARYYDRPSSFVAPKDSTIPSFDGAGLKGKVVGVLKATSQASFLQGEITPGGAQIKLYDTQDEAEADLATGRLDALFADKIVLADWLAKTGAACCAIKADIDPAQYPHYFGEGEGIAVRKTDTDLADKFSKAIADIVADGTYKKINDKYFPFSIY
jgi:lysine-arginine-ornithine-binding protein